MIRRDTGPKRRRIHTNRRQAEVQAFSATERWDPPTGTLGDLTRASFERAAAVAADLAELRARAAASPPAVPFASALRGPCLRLIAEVKRASPSKGAIAPGLDAADRATLYVEGGATAISVLTEPSRFGGSLQDLEDVARRVAVPVIRKDFIVAPIQLWEARAAGASAALLIARALSPDLLTRLVASAQEVGLAVLVEVRDERELARALRVGATVIGVNNRDLETLIIDPSTAPRLIRSIPAACIAVAESGMRQVEDVLPAAAAGADAILVGSAISASANPTAAVQALSRVPRRTR
ncbi:MAG: indole-3-glycerol-phosphate synthase [Gemmatimonadaceae bacterium]|nr:indole-3-glycerol-phosphate synthase [Gemmatimonadaceae bacterium]